MSTTGWVDLRDDPERARAFAEAVVTCGVGRFVEATFISTPLVLQGRAVGVSTWRGSPWRLIDAGSRPRAMPPDYPSFLFGMWALRKPVAAAAARMISEMKGRR